MAEITDKSTLKKWFKNNEKPTQEQFWAWMDSYYHKSEQIPLEVIENINTILAGKADKSTVDTLLEGLESKADRTIVEALQTYLEGLIDDSEASDATTYSSEKIAELIDQVQPSELIDDELEEGSVNTYSIDKIKELVENSAGGDLQSVTDKGNTTDKEINVQGATLGADNSGNLKLGKSALGKLAEIGNNLTAIGENSLALYDGSQGTYKERIVAIGNTAGANLKGGGYAVIIGTQAAASFTTTFVDVVIGSDAAKRATTSNGYNVVVGHGVAQKASILSDETIIGSTAMNKYLGTPYKTTNDPTGLTELTSGGNVTLGKWSLYSMLYGRENIAIGYKSGYYFLNHGEYNTFLGAGITTEYRQVFGNASVVIGAYAPIPENFNLSNKLIVHARRPEDPWVLPLIYGDFKERWLKVSGNLILHPQYTPDADKELSEGEEAFEPNKMLVVDAEGKVGVKSLQNSTENNDIIYYSFAEFLCEMPSDNSLNEDNFQIFPELFLNGKTATLILKGCFKFSDKTPLSKTIKLELPRELKFSKVIEYMDIACYGEKNGKLDMAWLSFKNTADSGLFELTTPPDGASAGMSTPVGGLYNFHQTIIFNVG
ncbi:hypothetical protein ETU09_00425 [Apibacter muscae]|uniref:Uncharacterized protein n=1 Tax=Apibacter muscae TaxID=2509004 RepID=A0A563DK68_9FLAO|nr:hypothetical protein [Apibacter muscae]TWP30499.1 hypothetical protein ETU09_00425 [Apibacter muscae]